MKEKAFYNADFKLGILGGGQLGRMLIQPCLHFGITTHVLDADEDAPCKNIATKFIKGSFKDYKTVLDFGKDCDIITIEIENVDADALLELEKQGKKIFPQPHIIKLIQDKGLQKQFYKENNFPTAEFYLVENKDDIEKHQDFLPAFQKARTAGYDGKGVFQIKTKEDIKNALNGPCVLEKRVDYLQEIAVIVARNSSGQLAVYEPIEQVFHAEKHLLAYLLSPGNFGEGVAEKAIKLAKNIAEKLEIVGLLAIEMFVTKNGEVLVNEMAPRPHNSGHQTIEGNITSQYEQHLRAILGLPLGSTEIIQPAVMVNLLGEENFSGKVYYEGIEKVMNFPGAHIHLYGKAETRPYRKMGHVTLTGSNISDLRKQATEISATLKVKA